MPYVLRARGPLKVTVAIRHGRDLGREHTSHMAAHVNPTIPHRQRLCMSFHIHEFFFAVVSHCHMLSPASSDSAVVFSDGEPIEPTLAGLVCIPAAVAAIGDFLSSADKHSLESVSWWWHADLRWHLREWSPVSGSVVASPRGSVTQSPRPAG